jgi:hypothetical protein
MFLFIVMADMHGFNNFLVNNDVMHYVVDSKTGKTSLEWKE